MKNLFVLISILLFAFSGVQAQDNSFDFRRTTDTYTTISPDVTVTDGDSIYIADLNANRPYAYVIDATASIDSVNYEANDTVFCTLQGRMFTSDSWTDINTQNLLLPAETNNVDWSLTANIYRYRLLRFYFHSKNSDTNWTVNKLEVKLTPANLTDEVN